LFVFAFIIEIAKRFPAADNINRIAKALEVRYLSGIINLKREFSKQAEKF
jgi:hypothetical protein